MFSGWMDADSLSGLCALGPSLSPQIPLAVFWEEDRTWIIIPILQMRRCGSGRMGGDQKLACGAPSPTSLPTPPQQQVQNGLPRSTGLWGSRPDTPWAGQGEAVSF